MEPSERRGASGTRATRTLRSTYTTALIAAILGTSIATPILAFATEAVSTTPTSNTPYDIALQAYKDGDYTTALLHSKMAGATGNRDAQVLVGHILMNADDNMVDKDEAVKWFLRAAIAGHDDAMLALGELALASHGGLSASDAVKWLTQAANKGRTDAMRALADIYIHGKGTPPNQSQAISWLTKASTYGDNFANARLGDLLFDKDPVTALTWYEKAADSGNFDAAYIAAIMYAENFDIKPNAAKVAKYLSQAAEAGIPAAQADYGLIVYQGNAVPRSAERAAAWFKRAALGGDPEGRYLYAYTLAKGDGISKSYEDAYYWLLRAEHDSGKTGVEDYDTSRNELKQRLEQNVDAAILQRARTRAVSDNLMGTTQ
ncbi:MAG: hypothetical protein COA43_10535 [Robiginitomaculum sp.]|nr:MAG: hypothetical protein COA43_10535 [Robiginitomaculum sp.]